DDAPAVGRGLHLGHVVARDHEVERVPEREAVERDLRHLARVVGPEHRAEAGRPRAVERLARAGLEPGRGHRAALVVERDVPDRPADVGGVVAAPANERAFADGLYPAAHRALERFVAQYPKDARLPEAVLLLGKARLQTGDAAAAVEAFKRAEALTPPPGRLQESQFWEAEALFRLRRFADARAAYDAVMRADAA